MKRFLSVLLCLCMIATMLPVYAWEANPNAPAWIKILGMELTDGDYLASNDATAVSEGYTEGDEYVALYKDGVLVLNGLDIVNEVSSGDSDRCLFWDYDSAGKDDLVVELVEGTTNTMVDKTVAAINGSSGFSNGPSLTIQGKGTLNIKGATYGVWVWQNIIVQKGAVVNIVGETKSGLSNNSSSGSIIIKQGTTVNIEGNEYGVSSDNYATGNFIVQGGNLTVKGNTAAVNKVSTDFGGNTVYVGNDVTGADSAVWNGATDITTYKYISLSGFSDTVTTYDVTKEATSNGSFEVDFAESMADETVTITATPDSGYEVDSVTVTDEELGNVAVTGTANERKFTMPAKNVVVGVTFKTVAAPADFTALNIAIGKAEAVDAEKYTSASVAVLEAALAAAKAIDQTTTLDTEQSVVDAKAAELESAITGLVALADYTALIAAYEEGKTYSNANAAYTAETFNKLIDALAAAELPANKELTVQADVDALTKAINDAIAGLVKNVEVSFTAVAVADDASVAYAKANKIVLVFAEPVADSANKLIDKLNIADKVSDAVWTTDTVYTLTLKANHGLTNNAEVAFDGDETIFTVSGNAMADSKAFVVGNLEEAYQKVTATNMVATIVKASAKPGVQTGDKIVLVFNAPVYGNEASITVEGMTASAVSGTSCTVYEIALATGDSVPASFSYTDKNGTVITASTVNGSFGEAVAPVITRVLAVDNNGNATTEGDNIIISFNRPTNGSTTLDLSGIIRNSGYFLGDDYKYSWNDAKTELTITLGEYASLVDGLKVNLGNLGITDSYGTADYVGVDVKIEGSFGTTVAPKITRAIAFTQNNKHIIRVFFNTEVTVSGAMSVYVENFDDDNATGKWTHNGISYYDMTLGDNHDAFVSGQFAIKFEGTLLDSETLKSSVVDASATIRGGFEQDIEPEILSLTAYSEDGSGIAKVGDKLVLVFNSAVTDVKSAGKNFVSNDGGVTWIYELTKANEIEIGGLVKFTVKALGNTDEMSANIGGSFGYKAELKLISATAVNPNATGLAKGGEIYISSSLPIEPFVAQGLGPVTQVDNDGQIWKITLADDAKVAIGDDLEFHITSKVTGESKVASVKLGGSFGHYVEPEVIKATAYSNDGSGIAKAGDVVVVVFNTPVDNVSSAFGAAAPVDTSKHVWKITLVDGTAKIGEIFTINATSVVTGDAKTFTPKLGGSFGIVIEPKLISATAYSNDGSGVAKVGDKIVLVFNMPVSGVTSALGSVTDVKDSTIWEITLTTTNIKVGDELTFNVTSIANSTTKALKAKLGGSFGIVIEPKIISATAYSRDGSGIAKEGDTIVVTFNTEVEGVIAHGLGAIKSIATEDGYNFVITLGANPTVTVGHKFNFTATPIATGVAKEFKDVTLGGSFGYKVTPAVVSATAYSNDGSGIAKKDDVVVVVFNTPVDNVSSAFGAAAPVDTSKHVWKITLVDGAAKIGEIFTINATSIATGDAKTFTPKLGGSFGIVIEPKLISATAYSNNGSGVAKVGDKVVLVFNMPVSGVTSALGSVTDVKDSTIWEISLTNTNVKVGDELTFNVRSILSSTANSNPEELKAKLGGSFGNEVKAEILSATYISQHGYGKPLAGDKIIVVFNTLVNVVGGPEEVYYYEYVLKSNGEYAPGKTFEVKVVNFATGKEETLKATIAGSVGHTATVNIKSAILGQENNDEVLTVVFDRNTNAPSEILSTLQANNKHLGTVASTTWTSKNVLRIVLGKDATTTATIVDSEGKYVSGDKLNLSGLGIAVEGTGDIIENLDNIPITGSLVPVVEKVKASGNKITVKFSARTNREAKLSAYTSLFGIGATASWDNTGKELTIVLGSDYTIKTGGYIVLNAMGIYDGFSGEHQVVGQYRITEGAIDTTLISVKSIMAQSDDVSTDVAKVNDRILIKLNSATNLYGTTITAEKAAEILSVNGFEKNEDAFGEGFSVVATAPDMIVIQLGNDPTITVGAEIIVSNVCFANGEGKIDPVAVALGGSFDGREFAVNNAAITRTNEGKGDYKVSFNLDNIFSDKMPRVACVAYSGSTPVMVSRFAGKVAMGESLEVEFVFAGMLKVTSAKIYVFDEVFEDEDMAPDVLANVVEAK